MLMFAPIPVVVKLLPVMLIFEPVVVAAEVEAEVVAASLSAPSPVVVRFIVPSEVMFDPIFVTESVMGTLRI